MLTTGVDIVEIQRIRQTVDRWGLRFLNRIYTEGELQYCKGRAESLAARFAAKEATMKALGTGTRGVSWRDVEVVRDPGKAPTLRLHASASHRATTLGLHELSLSISHSKQYAIALVVGRMDNPL